MWPQDQEEAGSGQWPDWVSAAEKAGLEGRVTVVGGKTILQWRHLTSHSQTDLGRGLIATLDTDWIVDSGYRTLWLSQVMSEIFTGYVDSNS